MRSCEDVLDLLPEVLPHLPPLAVRRETLEVQEHLRLCVGCADAADELSRVVVALKTEAEPAPVLSPDFTDRVMDALPSAPGDRLRAAGPTLLRLAAAVAIFAGGFGAAAWTRGPAQPVAEAPLPRVVVQAPQRTTPAPMPLPERRPQLAVMPATARPARDARPLERYVTEANLVLEAVSALEHADPHWLGVISRHVDEEALLEQGEALLVELQRSSDRAEARRLRPLISATQVVLRRVRHASGPEQADATFTALRSEVRDTGLLDAYRSLFTRSETPDPDERGAAAQPGVTDPL